jgi:hypothetical protein
MKYFSSILLLVLISCNRDIKDNKSLLPNIKIEFQSGCTAVKYYSILINNKNGQLVARKIAPNYYYGDKTDSIWEVVLDKKNISVIKKFIQKAKELNGKCPIKTTSINDYLITINNKPTYKIKGNCDWEDLDYKSIEKLIFKRNYEILEKKRITLKDSIIDELKGHWILNGFHEGLKKFDLLSLCRITKLSDVAPNTIVWTFSDSLKFKSLNNRILDLTYSKDFVIGVEDGSVSLNIGYGDSVDKDGILTMANEGVHLRIKKITKETIILGYWGR